MLSNAEMVSSLRILKSFMSTDAMAFHHFFSRSGGSNLNSGSRTGSTTPPGTAADLSYLLGNYVQSTGVFTVASGNPVTDGLAVNDYVSIYATGATETGFVSRVTARDATTITVNTTGVLGTNPTNGTGDRNVQVGGAWAGPSGTVGFPFGLMRSHFTSGEYTQVNFCNDQTYSMTAAMTHNVGGIIVFRGYGSAVGDGGKAIFTGPTTGASFVLLTLSTAEHELRDLIFQNNGDSGSSNGVVLTGSRIRVYNCVFNTFRGNGLASSGTDNWVEKCEAYSCNASGTADNAGISFTGNGTCIRCISHHNSATNTHGFRMNTNTGPHFMNCIAYLNASHGFSLTGQVVRISSCDSYRNTGSGMLISSSLHNWIQDCNLLRNGGWGINKTTTAGNGFISNCGFGSGATMQNTSGTIQNGANVDQINIITYPSNVTPWRDPDNGDFRITLRQAINAGLGDFCQTYTGATWTGSVGYPDIGSNQAFDISLPLAGGGSSLIG